MALVIPFLICALGYLLGSIPTGYWIGKISKGIDVREIGSGSTGATNVLRCVGKKEAVSFQNNCQMPSAFVVIPTPTYVPE